MSATATNFLNSKMRRIFQSTRGKFFAKVGEKKTYGIKAIYRTVGRTGARKKILEKSNVNVPAVLQGAAIKGCKPHKQHKTRANKGVMRMNEARGFQMVFGGRKMPGGVRKPKAV